MEASEQAVMIDKAIAISTERMPERFPVTFWDFICTSIVIFLISLAMAAIGHPMDPWWFLLIPATIVEKVIIGFWDKLDRMHHDFRIHNQRNP